MKKPYFSLLAGMLLLGCGAASAANSPLQQQLAEMDKGASAPTLFQCGNKAGLDTWGDFCYDLSGTDVYKQMTTNDFNLYKESGELAAIGYC